MRDTDLAITFFTFLTLLANAATLGLAGTAGAARLTGRPAARRAWARLHREVADGAVGLSWLVAAVAMSGSLYFSEVAGFTPCRLCWAQRACMYPLVALLAVAARTRRPAWRALGLALATVGAGIAVYHVLVERFPTLESGTCDPANPCSLVWFERYGFVTLPYMALSGFALIAALLLTAGLRSPAHPGTQALGGSVATHPATAGTAAPAAQAHNAAADRRAQPARQDADPAHATAGPVPQAAERRSGEPTAGAPNARQQSRSPARQGRGSTPSTTARSSPIATPATPRTPGTGRTAYIAGTGRTAGSAGTAGSGRASSPSSLLTAAARSVRSVDATVFQENRS